MRIYRKAARESVVCNRFAPLVVDRAGHGKVVPRIVAHAPLDGIHFKQDGRASVRASRRVRFAHVLFQFAVYEFARYRVGHVYLHRLSPAQQPRVNHIKLVDRSAPLLVVTGNRRLFFRSVDIRIELV